MRVGMFKETDLYLAPRRGTTVALIGSLAKNFSGGKKGYEEIRIS
jgi:hypothetical protein